MARAGRARRGRGRRWAAALAVATLVALQLAGGTHADCLPLRRKACRRSSDCKWGGKAAGCAVAADHCDAVQGKRMRKKCAAAAEALCSGGCEVVRCGCTLNPGKKKGKCGTCAKIMPEGPVPGPSPAPAPPPGGAPAPVPGPGPAPAPVQTNGRFIAIGDSMMAANRREGESIAQVMAEKLGITGEDVARGGAAVLKSKPGEPARPGVPAKPELPPIPTQYVDDNWAYVIMNGGINDINGPWCGNGDEGMALVDQIVSADASSGAYVDIVKQAQANGSKVVLISYPFPTMPDKGYYKCEREVTELTRRYRALAEGRDGVGMVDSSDYMIAGDASFFATDGSHPSAKGSEAVGLAVAALLSA